MTETPEIHSVRTAAAVLQRAAKGYAMETIRREISTAPTIGGIFLAAGLSEEAKDEIRDVVRGFILEILEGSIPPETDQIQADLKAELEDHAADFVRNEVLGTQPN